MLYNPKFLDNTKILNSELKQQLNEMNNFVKEKGLSDQMIQSFGIDFIYTSAQIEGNTYSKAETIALIEYGRTAGGKLWSEAMMIQNLKKAFNYVNDQDLKFNLENIKNIHFILSDQLVLDSERGNIRNKEVKIGGSSYIPLVNQNKLNDELKYLILQVNKIDDPFEKAIYAHMNIAYLQYFADVNKRTARVIQNLILKEHDIMYFIPRVEDIAEYIDSMISYYETGFYEKYINYFVKTYDKNLEIFKEQENNFTRDFN